MRARWCTPGARAASQTHAAARSRGAAGPAHGVIETPQLAARAGIHVAHAADDAVRLVIQVQAVGDELVEIDFERTFRTATTAIIATVARSSRRPSPLGSGPLLSGPLRSGPRLSGRPSRGGRASRFLTSCSGAILVKPRLPVSPTPTLPARRAGVSRAYPELPSSPRSH